MNHKQTSLLAAFAASGVEYAVVGGVAVNAHGYVREGRSVQQVNPRALLPRLRQLGNNYSELI